MPKRPVVRQFLPTPTISSESYESVLNQSTIYKEMNENKEDKPKRKLPVVHQFTETSELSSLNTVVSSNKMELENEKKKIKKCLARVTNDSLFEYFGDRHHKFYFEFRCNYPCFENRDVCIKCLQKKINCNVQTSRLFDHGMIYEAIPDRSHIFGGKWYQENELKWGSPPSEIIEFALEHQRDARGKYEVIQPIYDFSTSKAKKQSNSQEMPPRKKAVAITVEETKEEKKEEIQKPKRGRKPKVMTIQDLPPITEPALPESDPTKCIPKITKQSRSSPEHTKSPPKPKRKPTRKKSEPNPYESLVQTQPLIYKDVSIPTHMEEILEEFNTDDYEIEYVKIKSFTIGSTSYFRDYHKNKLYRKIKEKIVGEYIGRYDPETDSIVSDIPDSDDESEE